MEAREYLGRQLSETDYAIRSRAAGDDLDAKVSRASLDLAALREEISWWHEKLGRISAIMRAEQRRTQEGMQRLLNTLLEEPPPITDVHAVLMDAAAYGVAREVITGTIAAGNVLAAYLEQQEKLLGEETPNAKGRVRVLRAELERYRDIAETATRFLQQNPRAGYEDTQRAQLEVSAYTRKQRELAQLESQLVDPKTYVPHSDEAHLKHLVLAALVGGK